MAGHVRDLLAIGHAPEPQVMVIGARHRAAAIGAEANGVDLSLMPFEPVQQLRLRHEGTGTQTGIPDNGKSILAALTRNQPAAIGRKGEAQDHIRVPLQQRHELAARELVEADFRRFVLSACCRKLHPPAASHLPSGDSAMA